MYVKMYVYVNANERWNIGPSSSIDNAAVVDK